MTPYRLIKQPSDVLDPAVDLTDPGSQTETLPGSLPPSAGPEVTHRGVAVHDRDCAPSGGEGFRAHDREGIVEGHHLAATHAASGMHVIVAVRTPTFDEAVFPQLK